MRFHDVSFVRENLLKGSLHVHTDKSPCGLYPLQEVLDLYFGNIMNYDFLAITDHMVRTPFLDCTYTKLLLSGEEFKRKSKQILGIGIGNIDDNPDVLDNHQNLINEINKYGGVSVICHPHLYYNDYWSYEDLSSLYGFSGIEIYNHNEKMNNAGRSLATDLWDKLLNDGRKIYGYANDDMHHSSRVGGGYMMVAASNHKELLDALRVGLFYSSTGLDIKSYEIVNNQISIRFDNEFCSQITINIIVDGMNKFTFLIKDEDFVLDLDFEVLKYIRVEAEREDGSHIWFQPHFIEGGLYENCIDK